MVKVLAGRKTPPPGYKTAKQRIEETPDIRKAEMIWFKKRELGQLFPVGIKRKRWHVSSPQHVSPEVRSHIHTHLSPRWWEFWKWGVRRNQALPSTNPDLKQMPNFQMRSPKIVWHIASINNRGEVTGYTSFQLTKEFRKTAYDKAFEKLVEREEQRGADLLYFLGYRDKSARKILEQAIKEKLIRAHFTPMPGYKYQNGRFVRKK